MLTRDRTGLIRVRLASAVIAARGFGLETVERAGLRHHQDSHCRQYRIEGHHDFCWRSIQQPRDAAGLSLVCQILKQRLGVLQVSGVEAFSEPVVDVGEHRAGFIATGLAMRANARRLIVARSSFGIIPSGHPWIRTFWEI